MPEQKDDVDKLRTDMRRQLNDKVDDRRIQKKNPSVSDLLEGQSKDFLIPNHGPQRVLRLDNKLYFVKYQNKPDYDNVVGE